MKHPLFLYGLITGIIVMILGMYFIGYGMFDYEEYKLGVAYANQSCLNSGLQLDKIGSMKDDVIPIYCKYYFESDVKLDNNINGVRYFLKVDNND